MNVLSTDKSPNSSSKSKLFAFFHSVLFFDKPSRFIQK